MKITHRVTVGRRPTMGRAVIITDRNSGRDYLWSIRSKDDASVIAYLDRRHAGLWRFLSSSGSIRTAAVGK